MKLLEEDPEFTPRNVAKYAVTFVIKAKVGKFVKNVAEDYTSYERDDTIVRGSAYVISWGVSAKLKPYTDKVVDKTADYVAAKREQRRKDQDQKDQNKPEEQ